MGTGRRTYPITAEQLTLLRQKTWSVAFRRDPVLDRWYCHLYLLGGHGERQVHQVLGL